MRRPGFDGHRDQETILMEVSDEPTAAILEGVQARSGSFAGERRALGHNIGPRSARTRANGVRSCIATFGGSG